MRLKLEALFRDPKSIRKSAELDQLILAVRRLEFHCKLRHADEIKRKQPEIRFRSGYGKEAFHGGLLQLRRVDHINGVAIAQCQPYCVVGAGNAPMGRVALRRREHHLFPAFDGFGKACRKLRLFGKRRDVQRKPEKRAQNRQKKTFSYCSSLHPARRRARRPATLPVPRLYRTRSVKFTYIIESLFWESQQESLGVEAIHSCEDQRSASAAVRPQIKSWRMEGEKMQKQGRAFARPCHREIG